MMMKKKWFFDPLKPLSYDLALVDLPTRFETHTAYESEKGAQYPTMNDSWIRALPMSDLSSGNTLYWFWSTMPKLKATIEWMSGWGIDYVTAGAWHKKTVHGNTAAGTGMVLQSKAEVYLIGRIGRPKYFNRPQSGLIETINHSEQAFNAELQSSVPEVIEAVRREHSRKPDEQYNILDALMGPDIRRCELFARTKRPGWDAWGNQTEHFAEAS